MSFLLSFYDSITTYIVGPEPAKPVKDEEPVMQKISRLTMDPMSAMIQIGLLYHKKVGTKLNMCDHRIYFQEVGSPAMVQRQVLGGASREDLVDLKPLIQTAVRWYQPRTNEKVQKIFLRTIKGLEALKETYKASPLTIGHIDSMIKCISDAILKGVPKLDPKNQYQAKVKALWSDTVIAEISGLLDKLPGKFSPVVVREEGQKVAKDSGMSKSTSMDALDRKTGDSKVSPKKDEVKSSTADKSKETQKPQSAAAAATAASAPAVPAQQPVDQAPIILEANTAVIEAYNETQIAKYETLLKEEVVSFFTYG